MNIKDRAEALLWGAILTFLSIQLALSVIRQHYTPVMPAAYGQPALDENNNWIAAKP